MEDGGGGEEPHSNETEHPLPSTVSFQKPDKSQMRRLGKSVQRSGSENHPPFHSGAGRSHPGIRIASLLKVN